MQGLPSKSLITDEDVSLSGRLYSAGLKRDGDPQTAVVEMSPKERILSDKSRVSFAALLSSTTACSKLRIAECTMEACVLLVLQIGPLRGLPEKVLESDSDNGSSSFGAFLR